MKHLYNVFHFKGLCKHHSVVSVPGLVLNGELRGPEGWLGAKCQWWGLDTRAQRDSLGAPSGLLVRLRRVTVSGTVFAHFKKEETSQKVESMHGTHTGPHLGRDRDKHICQRDISVMTISDFAFFMLQLYLMVTPFWKMKTQTENPFKRETKTGRETQILKRNVAILWYAKAWKRIINYV